MTALGWPGRRWQRWAGAALLLLIWTLISAFGVGLGYTVADWLFWLLDAGAYAFGVQGR